MTLSTSQVALYGADTVDYLDAVAVAEALTVSPLNVTGNFNTAANWVKNGSYFVIAVGGPASNALYYNPCTWSTTAYSGYPSCHTPFAYYAFPYDGSIVADKFMPAVGAGRIQSLQLALMLGFYAIHAGYPSGLCCLPTISTPSSCPSCAGSTTNSCPTTS